MRPYLEKPLQKKGLVEWLKVKTLNSNPSISTKQNKTKQNKTKLHLQFRVCLLKTAVIMMTY
jgi:hypothetical protein